MTQPERRPSLIAQKAIALCGRAFRLHGRDEAHGLDCIGLVHACLDHAGLRCDPPNGYSIRAGSPERISEFLTGLGLARLRPGQAMQSGDIVLVRPGALQLHLMVRAAGGFVHAHAGIGRVVWLTGDSPWPVIAVFRVEEE